MGETDKEIVPRLTGPLFKGVSGVWGWHGGGFISALIVNSRKWYTPLLKKKIKKIILEINSI